MFSPLEQFIITPIFVIPFQEFVFFITYFGLGFFLVFLIFLSLIQITSAYSYIITRAPQVLSEQFYFFILSMLQQQTTLAGRQFFPILYFNFMFILVSNILSLFPFGFTITAQFMMIFVISLTFNICFLFIGLELHGFSFFRLFYRADLSRALQLLLIPIEIFSYLLRTISLSVRLFANMMAGHTLIHIITGFIIVLLAPLPTITDVILLLLLFAIFTLELGVAFLQAFIFTILLAIYLNEAINPSH
jgi:ATP synthase subunit 6